MSFDWMTPRARRDRAGENDKRGQMYRTEISQRAAVLRRLGYPAGRARSRLLANLTWELGDDRPAGLGDRELAKLVDAAFKS